MAWQEATYLGKLGNQGSAELADEQVGGLPWLVLQVEHGLASPAGQHLFS